MNTYEAIRVQLHGAHHVLTGYLNDMTDTDLMIRPLPGMNHLAWQLGHLIVAEHKFIEGIKPGFAPKLAAGFEASYSKEMSKIDDSTKFHTKEVYIENYSKQRKATLSLLETMKDEDFDKPGPEFMRKYAPTVGAAFIAQGNHELMHAGQFVATRRKLGKPVVI